MKFGAFVPQGWRMDLVGVPAEEQWPTMLATARKIESLGFDTAWVYDHFHTVPEPTQEATHECWTLMSALAATTETVRLGQMCTCNSYRPPSYLAKVATTVDVISGGRVEFGIGAGWYEHEYLAYGYDFPQAGVRIAQLDEAVQIIRKMWTEEDATFEGEHFSVTGAINEPKPLQTPHPPLWIAGGGEKKTLRIVAKYGDYANFTGTTETFFKKSQILDQHCEAVGRDPGEIGRTIHLLITVVPDQKSFDTTLQRVAAQSGRDLNGYLKSSQTVVGTPDQVVEQLAAYKDVGCVHTIGYFSDAVWGDSLDLFAAEVMPQLR
ncbi:MAG: LLM class F420-dependent oxidoreductase [Acidimicrobiia bacterium]